ncbi:MAG: zinc-dependent metalloprotease [Actinomyces sp.]|jgi:putative hydrolase|nr:zinc-dependent metalloprotease [Actinomyces sp.]MCI1787933.1 zinc-dependent metalloprotease [Actinomyces sp.]MCI1830977.1 zinc-dependent metalloprotease [Actinomyces sp.]MCI1866306.1 zinc-dependent metalloprotease [Actinomyces sp.]
MSDSGDTPTDGPTDAFEEFLRRMLGDQAGAEAARSMREQGFDVSPVNAMFGDPAQMQAAFTQFQYLFNATEGPVNWQMATDLSKQRAFQAGDPSLTAAEAQRARDAMVVADLWLDAATDFGPGQVQRAAWTRSQWIDETLPMWRRITEPVASNVSRALCEALSSQLGDQDPGPLGDALPKGLPPGMADMLGRTTQMMPRLAAMMFAMQMGQALAALAQEAMGSTDVGLPLADGHTTALVVHNIGVFGEGLEIPYEEVQQFMAVRECAHQRLFASVPWLSHDLVRAVENYSSEIAIDTDAIADAAREINPTDPASLDSALSRGVFSPEPTSRQQAALERLETLLALVEGWVEVVAARAAAPYLPHADQLREMMRRRRAAGGPAEQVLGQLIGLQMRPRRARGAARVFTLVEDARGREAREALWQHPDMAPTAAELDAPDSFLDSRDASASQDAEIDAALSQLLDGTLGWADGLSPDTDPEADSLRRAGFLPDDGSDGEDGASPEDSPHDPTDPEDTPGTPNAPA